MLLICDLDLLYLPSTRIFGSFLANVISGWEVKDNQSSGTESSDLQVAKVNGTTFTMEHMMALINVNVTTNSVNTKKLVIKNGSSTVTAYNTSTTSNFSCCAIIRPQTIASSADFATVTTGNENRNYKLPSEMNFSTNSYYSYPVLIKADGTISFPLSSVNKRLFNGSYTQAATKTGDGSVVYTSSNTSVAAINASTGALTLKTVGTSTITATVTDGTNYRYPTNTATYSLIVDKNDVKLIPLWYISEYNVNNSAGTSFATTANAGYMFDWNTAMTTFTGATTSYDTYTKKNRSMTNGGSYKWHLGIFSEWLSIFPAYQGHTQGNLGLSGYSDVMTVKFGYNSTTKNGIVDKSWWYQKSGDGNEIHAIRFLGTDYCSAWKYKYASNTLTVSATLIDVVAANATAAQTWYNSNWSSTTFDNSNSNYRVQRTFYSYGYRTGNGSTVTSETGNRSLYWTTLETSGGANAYIANIGREGNCFMYPPGSKKEVGATIRLFIDN